MPTLDILCPECGERYSLGEEMRGAKVQCAECGTKFLIYEDGSVHAVLEEQNFEKHSVRDDEPADWDEGARPSLEIFLTLHCTVGDNSLSHVGKPTWAEEDFQKLLIDLRYRGYGWLHPEVVRRKLETMAADWQGPPPPPGDTEKSAGAATSSASVPAKCDRRVPAFTGKAVGAATIKRKTLSKMNESLILSPALVRRGGLIHFVVGVCIFALGFLPAFLHSDSGMFLFCLWTASGVYALSGLIELVGGVPSRELVRRWKEYNRVASVHVQPKQRTATPERPTQPIAGKSRHLRTLKRIGILWFIWSIAAIGCAKLDIEPIGLYVFLLWVLLSLILVIMSISAIAAGGIAGWRKVFHSFPRRCKAGAPFPTPPPLGTVTRLRNEELEPFVLKYDNVARLAGPDYVQQQLKPYWQPAGVTTRALSSNGIYLVLSKDAGSPTTMAAAFSLNASTNSGHVSGWILVPPEILGRIIKPDRPVSEDFQASLHGFYKNVSSKLYSDGACCGLLRFENGNGMRVDIKEDPKCLDVLLFKTTFLRSGSYGVNEFEPEMVLAWGEGASVQTQTVHQGKARSDGWSAFEILRSVDEIESASRSWPPPSADHPIERPRSWTDKGLRVLRFIGWLAAAAITPAALVFVFRLGQWTGGGMNPYLKVYIGGTVVCTIVAVGLLTYDVIYLRQKADSKTWRSFIVYAIMWPLVLFFIVTGYWIERTKRTKRQERGASNIKLLKPGFSQRVFRYVVWNVGLLIGTTIHPASALLVKQGQRTATIGRWTFIGPDSFVSLVPEARSLLERADPKLLDALAQRKYQVLFIDKNDKGLYQVVFGGKSTLMSTRQVGYVSHDYVAWGAKGLVTAMLYFWFRQLSHRELGGWAGTIPSNAMDADCRARHNTWTWLTEHEYPPELRAPFAPQDG